MQPNGTGVETAVDPSQPGPADGGMGSGNVAKIRDILFGTQMRDYDSRFARLEEILVAQASDIRDTTGRRLEALETYVKTELDAVQARIRSEREERTEQIRQASRDVKELGDALNNRLHQLEDETSSGNRNLREQILQQSRQLLDEMRARQAELNSLLDRRSQELASSKTDRNLLAALFTEAALKLKDEFRIPGAEG